MIQTHNTWSRHLLSAGSSDGGRFDANCDDDDEFAISLNGIFDIDAETYGDDGRGCGLGRAEREDET